MTHLSPAPDTLHAKLVYYGPAMGGKTTNLQLLHQCLPPAAHSELLSEATEVYRILSMDILRPSDPLNKHIIFHLFTTPGCVLYEMTRTQVLRGADGVVYVVDSQRDKLEENILGLKELARFVSSQGRDLERLPVVLQYNKRDLPNALPIAVLEKYLNPLQWPYIEAIASQNQGVMQTFDIVCQRIARVL